AAAAVRVRHRLCRQRRAVSAHAVCRGRPNRHAYHRGRDAVCRQRPPHPRRLRDRPGAAAAAGLRRGHCRAGPAASRSRRTETAGMSLVLEHVSLRIGDQMLIADLSLAVRPREIVTVTGPSGSGKSSLLAFIGGHLDPAFAATGRVYLNDRDITALPPHRRRAGILFQDALLFPHMSVGANLSFGLPPGLSRSRRRAKIAAALAEAELEGFADRDPATLSGGQRA